MLNYQIKENSRKIIQQKEILCFGSGEANVDEITVKSFGKEWLKFDAFNESEIQNVGNQYFDLVTDKMLNKKSTVLDLGCGSGRWTKYMADRAGFIEAVDPSDAIFRAAAVYGNLSNVRFTQAGVDTIPFDNHSFDFVISLGVLHHIPDTAKALKKLMEKLKPAGYALIYLYYSLDNRSFLYKTLFHLSTFIRRIVSHLPSKIKLFVCDLIAIFIYLPLIGLAKLFKGLIKGDFYLKLPLAYYRDKSWKIIRNDALDRFGTPLEQRFSKAEITEMMFAAGMTNIKFSDGEPFWHLVAQKKN